MSALISVIIPIYKVERYLDRCIKSVVNQSYKNLEIILVDDGSPDNCGIICDSWAKRDERIVVLHKENGGLSSARNEGMKLAHGDYYLFIDSDDWVYSTLCEGALNDCYKYNADIVVFGYVKVNENNGRVLDVDCPIDCEIIDSEEGIKRLVSSELQNYAWNKLYKAELFNNIEYPEGKVWEDIGTTYKVFAKASIILLTNRILYNYVVRDGSITMLPSSKAILDIFELRYQQYLNLLNLKPNLGQLCLPQLCISAVEVCIRLGKNAETIGALEFLRSVKGQLKIKNYKIRLIWANEQVFFILFNILNRNRSKLKYLKNRVKKVRQYLVCKHTFISSLKKKFIKKESLSINNTCVPICYIIGLPDHDNLGDHAITLASKRMIKKYNSVYTIHTISENNYWKLRTSLKKNIKKEDIIVLHGGGNIGNQYMYIENIRRDVIKKFSSYRKIIFPQTVYFTNNKQGEKVYRSSGKLYKKANKLTIFAREKYSFDILKNLCGESKVKLCPDIVLSLSEENYTQGERKGIMLCLRIDREAVITYEERLYIRTIIENYSHDIYDSDTCIKEYCDEKKGEQEVYKKLNQFSGYQLIITDRLHGMVFAALTKTPCVAISNYNTKIKGVFDWIKKLNYISYIENISKMEEAIDKVLYAQDNFTEVFSQIEDEFKDLKNYLINM